MLGINTPQVKADNINKLLTIAEELAGTTPTRYKHLETDPKTVARRFAQ